METVILDPLEAVIEEEKSPVIKDDNILTMSTGVQFEVKEVSRSGLASISQRYIKTKPQAPMSYVESKGREEVNENDPDYLDALDSWHTSLAMAINNYLLLRGTEVVYVPDDVMHYESDEWKEEAEIIGIPSKSTRALYIEWIKMIAAPLNDKKENKTILRSEIARLLYAIGRKSGTAQEDVDEAVNRFRC